MGRCLCSRNTRTFKSDNDIFKFCFIVQVIVCMFESPVKCPGTIQVQNLIEKLENISALIKKRQIPHFFCNSVVKYIFCNRGITEFG